MLKKLFTFMALGLVAVAAGTANAQPYSNAVMALNPVAYWPLTETVTPPSGYYVATNLGTAGAAGNGFYQTWYQPSGTSFFPTNNILRTNGITGDGDTAMMCNGNPAGAGQYIILPRSTNGVANPAVAISAPFSVELWVKSGNTNLGLQPIVNEGRNPVALDPNVGFTNTYVGFSLGQFKNFFYFQIYNATANGNAGVPEADSPLITPNTWYHIVGVFDGTGIQIYANAAPSAKKTVNKSYLGTNFVMDPVSPLLIGTGTEFPSLNGGVNYLGAIDEVAIYPTNLSGSQISTHFSAVSGTGYPAAVLADSPTIYLRMDEPAMTTYPAPSAYPIANNYGSLGAAANGVYQPGTSPGAAGPAYVGFGASSHATAFNGFYGTVDIGGGALSATLNPTNKQPFSVVTWFQGNPADAPGRFQVLLGHSDLGWRIALDGNAATSTAGTRFNPGNGPELSFVNTADVVTNGFRVNDGAWHMAAGVTDGTNDFFYLDGLLAKSGTSVGSITGTNVDVALGGDPTYTVPTAGSQRNIRNFDGQLAQAAFFTNALSASQIQSLYSAAGVPPSIIKQPVSTTNNAGNNVTLTATARGSFPLSYQWYQNNLPVSGQTNTTLAFTPAQTNNAGTYYLVVTNSYGMTTSSVVTIFLFGPPTIQQQSPMDIRVFAGASPTLHVTAVGAQPILYQWSSNSVAISGATNSNYTVANAQASATYTCLLSNFVNGTSISPILLTVEADPTAPYPLAVLADHPAAFYRLDETAGTIAYDTEGGNNGTYTNVQQDFTPGYAPQSDPDPASEFGALANSNSYVGNVPTYLNFGAPNGSNAEFSVEAWANTFLFFSGNGIISIGYGNGGEEFVLDTGATGNSLRFFVRNAAGAAFSANSAYSPVNDGLWHHIVGVCDEAAGKLSLYMDGTLLASGSITAGTGVLSSSLPLTIGARQSGNSSPANYDFQFIGTLSQIAVYSSALSAAQVHTHYLAAGIAPVITQIQPFNLTTNQGANVTFSVSVNGTGPFTYQWTDPNNNPVSTNSTLSLTNVQPNQGGQYSVTVSGPFGSQSTNTSLSVIQGAPQVITDIQPLNQTVFAGDNVSYTVGVSGSAPLAFQWFQDGSPVNGATNATFTFAALQGTNTYYVSITNSFSVSQNGAPTFSSTGTVVGVPVPTLNPSNYTYKMKITFAGYNRNETLSDFPALVKFGTNLNGFAYTQFASPTGSDLRFAASNGARALPFEIDQWNDSNGVSSVWVQVPQLTSTNDFVWAYWGNPADTTLPDYATNGTLWVPPAFTALPEFEAVYHLKETGLPYLDSALQHTVTNGGPGISGAGIVGSGIIMAGSSYLDLGFVNLSNAITTNAFTVSSWVNVSTNANNIQCVWGNSIGGFTSAGFRFYVNSFNTHDGALVLEAANGTTGSQVVASAGVVPAGAWHMVAAALDHDAGHATLSVDGTPVASGTIRNDFPTTNEVILGRFNDASFPFNGTMDEARIRGGISSSNWLWASWSTVAQNSTFENYSAIASTAVTLTFHVSGNSLILSWSQGTLQSSATVNGGYANVPGATSPWTVSTTGPTQFYRVLVR